MRANPTVEAYNRYAQIYDDEVRDFWDNFPREFIDEFISNTPGERVLNLGSGSGKDAILLRDRGIDVVCVDASKSMVDMTSNLGFESHLAFFSELNFSATSFDGVWAYTSLIHLPKAEAENIITVVHELLKAGGTFVFGAIQGNAAGMIEKKTMPGVSRYFKNYTSNELKKLIEPLGFALLHEQKYQPHNNTYLSQLYTKS